MTPFAIIVKAHKTASDNRPMRYRYLAYDEMHAYRQFIREHDPNILYTGASYKILRIAPITRTVWEQTINKYSVNVL